MNKSFFILICILIPLSTFAQMQEGIVKTRGRMVNGQLVAGTKLSGVTITLNFGNPLVTGNDGAFSFIVPAGRSFSLVSAEKKGYTLVDAEYTRRSFKYSASNPFYVILEDENQRQADINAATRKVRNTLMAQLEKREEEIENLKAQKKITEKEYQEHLLQLYDNQSKSEQLVKDMAKRYASTDYDQLDEFNRQVQQCIDDGELQKADSLIRSKGDIEQRVTEYHRALVANKQEREELNRREAKLEQSEASTAKTYEDLSQDLLRRSEIFLQEFKQDSALYCLKMRADLDTTNVDAVMDYASLCHFQNKYEESEKYYMLALNNYVQLFRQIPDVYHRGLAGTQNNLGVLYRELHDYQSSEKYYMLSLENYEQLFCQNPDAYRADLARTQNNLGVLYDVLHDYQNCEKYYMLALENREQLFRQNPDAYRYDLARTQNNLGVLYRELHNYQSCEKYFMLALENKELLFRLNPDAYRADLASTQGNLGVLYRELHNYQSSEKYIKLALENYEQLFRQNPDVYREDLAKSQRTIGSLYYNLHDYQSCEKYYMLSLENYEQLFRQNPDVYRADLADTQNNLGVLYDDLHDYRRGKKYFMLALENYEQLFRQTPDSYREDLAGSQNDLGTMYCELHDYRRGKKYFMLALENYEQLFRQTPDAYREYVAKVYRNIMFLYETMEKKDESDIYLDKALGLYITLYAKQPLLYTDDVVELQNMKVSRLLIDGSVDEAFTLAKETYAIDEENEDSKVFFAVCCNEMAYKFASTSDFTSANAFIDKAISLMPDDADFYDSKGEFLLMQGKDDEALKMWKKVLELDSDYLKDSPDGTNLSNGLMKLGLIE